MPVPITGIISAIQSGIPLVKQITSLFKKKKTPKTDSQLQVMEKPEMVNYIKELESNGGDEFKSFLVRLGNLILTAATVYGVIWTAKKFGVTSEDIINLWGLLK